jgi:hypothetical protein
VHRTGHDASHSYVQSLWPLADSQPSKYFRFVLGELETFDIVFTHALVPAGSFSLDAAHANSKKSILYLNTRDFDYYQHGIPGVTASIEETVAWIQIIRARFGLKGVRTIGARARSDRTDSIGLSPARRDVIHHARWNGGQLA